MSPIQIIKFLTIDIWRIRSKELSSLKAFLLKFLRVFILTIRGITEDKCQLRASALTYYSLLSIVPVVAMIFGIGKGFGFEKNIESFLIERFEGQEQIVGQVVEFAQALLKSVKGGLVAGIGLIILFYTIIKILSHIENAFNDIWGVKKARRIGRKITDYLSLMLICPILFVLSSTITVVITSSAKFIIQKVSLIGVFGPAIFFSLKLLPYCALWILFSFLYIFIPNTKVQFRSGIMAGIIAGTTYVVFQWAYINFQIGVSQYNTIYGSFAALPLFFIWLQFSWIIVLFGAEIAFAHQNVHMYEFEHDCMNVSHAFKRMLSLRVVHLLVKHFSKGDKALMADQIAVYLEIPIRMVNQILYELNSSGIISEITLEDERSVAYQPAIDPDSITIKLVVDRLEQHGSNDLPVEQSDEFTRISESLKTFDELIKSSPANKLIKEI